MKSILTFLSACLIAGSAFADNHAAGPVGYGMSFNLSVSDPAAIAGAVTKVRTTDLGKDSPSSVSLIQISAGGDNGVTHSIQVYYTSAENIDKANAMSVANRVGEEIGPVFQAASERVSVIMWNVLRLSQPEGRVTSANPVSLGILLEVTDQAAFMTAFDAIWGTTSEIFPGNTAFGAIIANGENPATHYVSFEANDMATLLNGFAAMQASPEMAGYFANASSFRKVVGEQIGTTMLAFPEGG